MEKQSYKSDHARVSSYKPAKHQSSSLCLKYIVGGGIKRFYSTFVRFYVSLECIEFICNKISFIFYVINIGFLTTFTFLCFTFSWIVPLILLCLRYSFHLKKAIKVSKCYPRVSLPSHWKLKITLWRSTVVIHVMYGWNAPYYHWFLINLFYCRVQDIYVKCTHRFKMYQQGSSNVNFK